MSDPDPLPTDRPLAVTVAALTRRRPGMLADLIRSWAAMEAAPDARVRFLVVENDDAPRAADLVADLARLFPPGALAHVHEPELGIPFGRNRAADEAIAAGHDLLAFVDDDMVVAPDWLARLLAGYRSGGAMLLGAPMLAAPVAPEATWLQRRVHSALARRYDRKAARAAARASLTDTPGVTIVTNNWLGDLRLFTEHGLRFDEALRFTGGSDTRLYHQVRERGLRTGWVADALAWEVIPPDRLSLGYQYARGRDQSNQNLRRKMIADPRARWASLPAVAWRGVVLLALAVANLVTLGRWLPDLARTAGWIAGRVGAFTGRRSTLYENVTGN